MSKIFKSFIIFSVLLLIILNLSLLDRFVYISRELTSLRNIYNGLEREISDVSRNIYTANQKERLVSTHSYDIEYTDLNYTSARIRVNMQFNSLPNEAGAYLLYRDYTKSSEAWERAELTSAGGLNYYTNLQLSYDGNYNFQVLIESSDKKQSEELSSLDLKKKLEDRISIRIFPTRADSSGNVGFEIRVNNFYQNNDRMKLKSIKGTIKYKDNIIKEIDVMKDGQNVPDTSDTENWTYNGKLKIDNVENMDFMNDVYFEVVATDGLNKQYINNFQEGKMIE